MKRAKIRQCPTKATSYQNLSHKVSWCHITCLRTKFPWTLFLNNNFILWDILSSGWYWHYWFMSSQGDTWPGRPRGVTNGPHFGSKHCILCRPSQPLTLQAWAICTTHAHMKLMCTHTQTHTFAHICMHLHASMQPCKHNCTELWILHTSISMYFYTTFFFFNMN